MPEQTVDNLSGPRGCAPLAVEFSHSAGRAQPRPQQSAPDRATLRLAQRLARLVASHVRGCPSQEYGTPDPEVMRACREAAEELSRLLPLGERR